MLHCNIAACHLKLRAWKTAAEAASRAVACLDDERARVVADHVVPSEDPVATTGGLETEPKGPPPPPPPPPLPSPSPSHSHSHSPPAPEQTQAANANADAEALRPIRIKALMRRAAARAELGGWQDLVGAQEDYAALLAVPGVREGDARLARRNAAALPARIKVAQESEMGEMWGKLKDVSGGRCRCRAVLRGASFGWFPRVSVC